MLYESAATPAYAAARPRVSVVTPCYNHARYLGEAVASVIAQRYTGWELIIVDDGSTDNSAAVAHRLLERSPEHPIRLLRQPNGGISAARNTAIEQARAPYILPLDADDLLEPEYLAAAVPALEAAPEVGFVYTDVIMFGAEQSIWHSGDYSQDELCFQCLLCVSALFRRAAWRQVGGFRTLPGNEDWDFWLSMAEAGWRGQRIARPLLRYRRGSGTMLRATHRRELVLRAQLVLNHPRLYGPDFQDWARMVSSPDFHNDGAFRSPGRWLRAFASYAALVARHRPSLLPKTILRELFVRLSDRHQGYARRVARTLRISRVR